MLIEVIVDIILLVAVLSFNFYRKPNKLHTHVSKFTNKDYGNKMKLEDQVIFNDFELQLIVFCYSNL